MFHKEKRNFPCTFFPCNNRKMNAADKQQHRFPSTLSTVLMISHKMQQETAFLLDRIKTTGADIEIYSMKLSLQTS